MIPKFLTIENFKSFKTQQTLDFDSVDGLILISGDNQVEPELEGNGSGKSSMWEALTWLFFGKTSTNLKAGDIVNWKGNGKCCVSFTYEEDGVTNIITRTQNPNSLHFNNNTITQEELELKIKLNLKSFIYSIFISQFGDKFIDLSPSDKMTVFTEIMGEVLNKWSIYSDKAKTKRDLSSSELDKLEREKTSLEGKVQGIDIQFLVKKHEEEENKSTNLIDALTESIKKEYENLSVRDTSSALDILKNELKETEDKIKKLEEKDLKYMIEISATETTIRMKEKDKNSLDQLGTQCPTCLQQVDEAIVNKEIHSLSKEIFIFLKEIDDLNKSMLKGRRRTERLREEKEEILLDIVKLNEDILSEENKIRSIKDKEKELATLAEKENPYASILKEKEEELKNLSIKLEKLDVDISEKKRRFEAFKFLTKGFKDIRLMITSEALAEFEININNNIQKLGLSDEWRIKLDVMEETKSGSIKKGFVVLVESPFNKSSVPFECWSGGEGQRLRLAMSLGLSDFIKSRRGIDWNWIILDEPSQFLSQAGIVQMINTLKEKASNDQMKIFLIDHRKLPTLGEFDSIIEVIKTKEGSIINAK